jgi:hypothetical protein
MKKTVTLKDHIINYAKNKRYFNINDLKKYFAEIGVDFKKGTLKEYLYLLKKENVIYGTDRGWIGHKARRKNYSINKRRVPTT